MMRIIDVGLGDDVPFFNSLVCNHSRAISFLRLVNTTGAGFTGLGNNSCIAPHLAVADYPTALSHSHTGETKYKCMIILLI